MHELLLNQVLTINYVTPLKYQTQLIECAEECALVKSLDFSLCLYSFDEDEKNLI